MALTRGLLDALGIDEKQADEIIKAHVETVTGLKGEIEKLTKQVEEGKSLQKKLDTLTAEKESGENPFKTKYEELKKAFDEYKAEGAAKELKRTKTEKVKELLKSIGINEKRIDTVLKVTDLDSITITDGEIEGAQELGETMKSEWADFLVSEQTHGADVATPPSNTGGRTTTKAEILAIKDASERQAAIAANLDLFGH